MPAFRAASEEMRMRILGRLGMYLTLFGIILAIAVWYDSTPQAPYLFGIWQTPVWLVVTVIAVGLALWLISFLAKSLRRTLICASIAVGILLLLILALKVDAYVLRYRTARLLADVQGLELRKTTFTEVRGVFQKWGKPTQDDNCDQNHCTFIVVFSDSISSLKHRRMPQDALWGWIGLMEWTSKFLGGRETQVLARVVVQRGVVWGKGFEVLIEAPQEGKGRGWHCVGGLARTSSRFHDVHEARPDVLIAQTLLHPDYLVEQWVNYQDVMYISGISVLSTPYADPAVVRRFEDFDLSCLTRWFACRTPADLMPTAWAQYQDDQPRVMRALKELKCTPDRLEAQARDAEGAAVVEVTGNRTDTIRDENHAVAVVRLVESLRGFAGKETDERWKVGTETEFWVSPWAMAEPSGNASLQLPEGKRLILLFHWNWVHQAPDLWLYPCGAIPWSEENLALVRRGIAEDTRANDPDVREGF
jgi:hypothetical protein